MPKLISATVQVGKLILKLRAKVSDSDLGGGRKILAVDSTRRVQIRVKAADATKVRLNFWSGPTINMEKQPRASGPSLLNRLFPVCTVRFERLRAKTLLILRFVWIERQIHAFATSKHRPLRTRIGWLGVGSAAEFMCQINELQVSERRDYESCTNLCRKYRINSLESKSQRAAAGVLPSRRRDQSTHRR